MKYFLILVLFFVGCATSSKSRVSSLESSQWKSGIYDIHSGERIEADELWRNLENANYILVGESHDSELDHELQKIVVERLALKGAVGFEMFQRPFQEVLNRFAKGEITQEEMLEQTQWEKRWGFKVDFYSPIWNSAKKLEADIVALNVRRELTKRIAKVGVEGLSEIERKDIVELDLSNEEYKKWLEGIFNSHGAKMTSKKLQRFFEAQVLWDETMADSAVKSLTKSGRSKMIMIVGRGHFEWDWGIPSRIRRRVGDSASVKVLIPSDGDLPSIELLKENRFADYVWVHEKKK